MSIVVDDETVDKFLIDTARKNLGKRGRAFRDGWLPPSEWEPLREQIRNEIGNVLKADVKKFIDSIKLIAHRHLHCVHSDLALRIRVVSSIYKKQLKQGGVEIVWYQYQVRGIYNDLLAAINPGAVEFVDNVFA